MSSLDRDELQRKLEFSSRSKDKSLRYPNSFWNIPRIRWNPGCSSLSVKLMMVQKW